MRALVIAVLMTMAVAANAKPLLSGNVVGNGGGLICISGKCQTLIEAGLRLSPEYNGVWIPEAFHFSQVKNSIADHAYLASSVRDKLFSQIFGTVDHFRKVEVIDPAKLEAIKQAYLDVAQDAGFVFDPKTFEVVAFSSDDTVTPAMTYLLPQFFALDLKHQASVLVHEGLYRGRPSKDLKYVLQFESSMAVVNTSNANIGANVVKPRVDQQLLAFRFGLINKAQLVGAVLSLANENPLLAFSFPGLLSVSPDDRRHAALVFDHTALLNLAIVEPRIPYMFSKVQSLELVYVGLMRSCDGNSLVVADWTTSSAPRFIDAGCGHNFSYEITNPDTIDLVLPD